MAKRMSPFEKWFKAQFGKLPRQLRSYNEINKDLAAANEKVYHLKKEMEQQQDLEGKFTAALYTMNAARKKFVI